MSDDNVRRDRAADLNTSGECVSCGAITAFATEGCQKCQDYLPSSLIKACYDEFDYALGLKSGLVINFYEAMITGNFAHLLIRQDMESRVNGYLMPRGIQVRISDIEWCCDAPEGS